MAKMAVSGPSGIATVQHQLKFLISIMSAKKKKVPKQNKETKKKTKQKNKQKNLSRPSFHLSLFHKRSI